MAEADMLYSDPLVARRAMSLLGSGDIFIRMKDQDRHNHNEIIHVIAINNGRMLPYAKQFA